MELEGRRRPAAARRWCGITLAAVVAVLAMTEHAAPCTLTTTGSATVDDGALFTLTLGAVDTGDGLPTSWTINWGDGAIQTYAGNPASVTHTYTAWATPSIFTYNILASAVCNGKTYFRNDLAVGSAGSDEVNWYRHDAATNKAVARVPAQSGPDFGLNQPVEAIVGPGGVLYVAGWSSGNVVRYDTATGAVIGAASFATGGTKAIGMAFGPDGHLYVADTTLKTVRRYHGTTGAFIDDFVTAGSGGITEPEGLKFGPDGNLYVSDYRNNATGNAVYRYNGSTGAFIDKFVASASGGLRNPEDLVFGPDGNLYVASDANHNVLRFQGPSGASPGAFIDIFVPAGSGGLENAQGVAFGPDGHFYVTSWKDNNVVRYDGTTGAFIDVYVSAGLGGLNTGAYFDFIPGHQVQVMAGVTAVELLSFTAVGLDGAVELEWETGSEVDNLGFQLYRSLSASGPYERITASLIPGLGSSPEGARYRYRDRGVANGISYFYELEDIETTGRKKRHGPVSATPAFGTIGEEAPRVDEQATAVIRYGAPEANRLRVVNRDRHRVVLELLTEGFLAYPEPDGSVRIEIADFVQEEGNGLPVKRTWVEAVAGRRVELVSIRERGAEPIGLRPAGSSEHEIVASYDGVVRLRRLSSRERARRAGAESSEAARLVQVAFQGEVKKALVEISPLSWDPSRQQLRLVKRLYVTLSFAKRDPDDVVGPDGRQRRSRRRHETPDAGEVVARLATVAPGLHAVTYEEVFGAGFRGGVAAGNLRLSRLGETVAHKLVPEASRFAPGATLYFVSAGAEANPYGDESVFELEYSASGGAPMPVRDAAPAGAGGSTTWYLRRDEHEENRLYQAALMEAEDRWMWDALFAPAKKDYGFGVDSLAGTPAPARLELWLQGGSDFPASPDHHVAVRINGALVAERSWDGKLPQKLDVELGPGVLREGENRLEIDSVGDTGAAYSMVFVDRYAVTYPRLATAERGVLEGSWTESTTAEVSEVSGGALLLDTTHPGRPVWLAGGSSPAGNGVRFRAEAEHHYLVVDPERVQRPEVRSLSRAWLKRDAKGADLVVIGPRAFLDGARPLLDHRRRQGLTPLGVPVEAIYEEFGFGESRPEAIRDFLAYAYHHWKAPSLRYVLLLGDATYDFKDYQGTEVANQVPPLMVETSFLWTASDPTYAAVNGEDSLPDLAIGRLPAASRDEVRAMVEKILAYESAEASPRAPIVLVSDDSDVAGDFEGNAEELAETVLAGEAPRHISLGELGTTATRLAVLGAFDQGAYLVSFIGHGGIQLWASENLLDTASVGSLRPQSQQPLVLTMNCLNGYFHFPFFDSLSEELVKAEDKGAIAAFSPSGMSLNGPAHRYHKALLSEIFHGNHQRLGDAVLAAQEAYAETGAFPELLSVYHLIGDPAMALR